MYRFSYSFTEYLIPCCVCSIVKYKLMILNKILYLFSTDEAATENILKAELTMAALCGRLGLVTSRDAFITAICKGSLPPHYALTVLNTTTAATLSNKCKTLTYSQFYSTSGVIRYGEKIIQILSSSLCWFTY